MSDHGSDPTVGDPPRETVHLGQFDPLEAPIVLDMLHEHGIFAFSKTPLGTTESQPYGRIPGDSGRGRIFVDAAKLDEARRLVDEDLPGHIADMQRALEEGFDAQEEIEEPGSLGREGT